MVCGGTDRAAAEMDDQRSYERALAQVGVLRHFYIHAVVYVLVIGRSSPSTG